eukprot:TRINITY_DN5683_c0_g1_i1.p1 TRINITY_DN5683_c0_g1~~TRINITY_DN5683_c0_g1_i1.p1  ORF type:complete len:182 (+),score=35.76 TRINITY_DN5683_c0_g1_i1:207-752(+)
MYDMQRPGVAPVKGTIRAGDFERFAEELKIEFDDKFGQGHSFAMAPYLSPGANYDEFGVIMTAGPSLEYPFEEFGPHKMVRFLFPTVETGHGRHTRDRDDRNYQLPSIRNGRVPAENRDRVLAAHGHAIEPILQAPAEDKWTPRQKAAALRVLRRVFPIGAPKKAQYWEDHPRGDYRVYRR